MKDQSLVSEALGGIVQKSSATGVVVTQRRVCGHCDYDKCMTWTIDTPFTVEMLVAALKKSRFKPHSHRTLPVVVTLSLGLDLKDARWLPPEAIAEIQKRANAIVQLDAAVKQYLLTGGDPDFVIMSKNDWDRNARISGYISGQEWYDMFLAEAQTYDWSQDELHTLQVICRKAAGIK